MQENIPEPTFTQTPNPIFDVIQPMIDPHELSILMVVVRKTYGFHKEHDNISNSQIEAQTGFTRPTVTKYAGMLEKRKLIEIVRTPGRAPKYSFGSRFRWICDAYTLRMIANRKKEPRNTVSTLPRNTVSTHPETMFPPPRNTVSTQKKLLNKVSKKTLSPNGDGKSLTQIHDEELGKAIDYIRQKTGVTLKADKHIRIWWYQAIRLDGLNNLKLAIASYCDSKINIEIGRWDWVSFLKIQAKRASYLPKEREQRSYTPMVDDIDEDVLARHREAAGV